MEQQITNQEIIERLKEIERNMATKQELEQAIETISILSNKETMEQIKNSEKDIANGNVIGIDSIDDL